MPATVLQSSFGNTTQNASLTRYLSLVGNIETLLDATEANRTTLWRTGGTFTLLSIQITANSVSAASTFRTRKGTSDANLSISITASTTGRFVDITNSDVVTAGDNWHASLVTGGSGTSLTFSSTQITFSATSNTSQRIGHGRISSSSASSTFDHGFYGTGFGGNNTNITVRTAATLKNFLIYISSNTRTTTTTYTSRKNTGAGAMSISLTSGTTGTLEDTSNSDTLADGDTFRWRRVTGSGTGTTVTETVCADFETTTDQHHQICGIGGGLTQNISVTNYFPMAGKMSAETIEANTIATIGSTFMASKLQCFIGTNTVTATSTLNFRKNSNPGNQTVSITASTTGVFEDASNTDSLASTDTVDYELVTGGSGTSLIIHSITLMLEKIPPIKTVNGLAIGNVKKINGVEIASVKTLLGIQNE